MNTKEPKEVVYSFSNFNDLIDDEVELIWKWRNEDAIRKWMYNSDIIAFDVHKKFVDSLRYSESKVYFLVKREDLPVGVFSLTDIQNSTGEWGYYIASEYHSRHLGVEFYYNVLKFVFDNIQMEELRGYALVENRGANSLNDLFGFQKSKVKRSENGSEKKYYYRHLSRTKWKMEVEQSGKIFRLLELTRYKHSI